MLSGRIPQPSDVLADILLRVRIGNGRNFPVADVAAKWVQVAIQKLSLSLAR